jgi:ABC-type nitrate/sulfonate/bicarbonate transport system permease component
LYESAAGFFLAFIIAFIGGTLIAEVPLLRRVMMPYLVAVNAAPKIALAPRLWSGSALGPARKL